jgi:hypothetical protein
MLIVNESSLERGSSKNKQSTIDLRPSSSMVPNSHLRRSQIRNNSTLGQFTGKDAATDIVFSSGPNSRPIPYRKNRVTMKMELLGEHSKGNDNNFFKLIEEA